MTRKCSYCGHNGHNSRTCPDRGLQLFGVRLTAEGSMRKSLSMGNLSNWGSPSNSPCSPTEQAESGGTADGYASDGMVQAASSSRDRKKGIPWSEEEHRMFLLGLQKLGKGDWKGISRNFVTTRTPTQVASHAQKYFIRQSNLNKRKRRSSLFDMIPETEPIENPVEDSSEAAQPSSRHELSWSSEFHKAHYKVPSGLSTGRAFQAPPLPPSSSSCVYMGGTVATSGANGAIAENTAETGEESIHSGLASFHIDSEDSLGSRSSSMQGPFGPVNCLPVPVWSVLHFRDPDHSSDCKIVRPTPVFPTTPIRIDAWNGISELNLGAAPPTVRPSSLSLKLSEEPTRHSAFHVNPSLRGRESDSAGGSAISVV